MPAATGNTPEEILRLSCKDMSPQLAVYPHGSPHETALTVCLDGKRVLTVEDGDRQTWVEPEFVGNTDVIHACVEAAMLAISARALIQ